MSTKSNWQQAVERSNYHFDWTRRDSHRNDYQTVAKFSGSWSEELSEALETAKPKTWATRGKQYHPDDSDLSSELLDLDLADMNRDTVIFRKQFDLAAPFVAMVDALGMTSVKSALHIQFPGEMLNLHIDKQREMNDDISQVSRFFIFLEDWCPGHFVQMGTSFIQWSRGDVVVFDWANMPHATANAGWRPRSLLQVTGTVSHRTREIIAGLHPVIDI